ncbi:MAG: hypothetical protein DRN27_05090 [Thermoplasmata archaeon]|nr:MAG: hypothetical protein DRN27_05090 [Thermoplasmata archaeon]
MIEPSRQLCDFFLNNTNDIIFIVDKEGVIQFVTPSIIKSYKLEPGSFIKSQFFELVDEKDLKNFNKKFQTIVKKKTNIEIKSCSICFPGSTTKKFQVLLHNMIDYSTINGIVIILSEIKAINQKNSRIQESIDNYKILFENAREAICIAQGEKLVLVNDSFEKLSGLKKEEVYKKKFVDFIHPNDREDVINRYHKRLKGKGGESGYQFRIVNLNNDILWVEIHVSLFTWKGKPATLNFLIDVTGKKEIEEKYQFLFNTIPDALSEVDYETRKIISANDEMIKRFQIPRDKLIGMNYSELLPNDIHNDRGRIGEEVMKENKMQKFIDQRGNYFLENSYIPVKYPTGKKTLFIISKDITDIKQAEKEVVLSENKFKEIFNSSTDAIFIHDIKDLRILDVNDETCKRFGYTKEEILKKSVNDLSDTTLFDINSPQSIELMKQVLSGKTVKIEWLSKTKKGKLFWHEINGKLIEFDGKKRFLAVARDINERKEAEFKIKESERKYRFLFNSSRDAIMTLIPPNWNFSSANPATLELFKAEDEKEFVNISPWDISSEYQPDGSLSSDLSKKMIEKAINDGSNFFEWTHKTLKGEEFPASVLLTRVELEKGKPFLQATVRDISYRKKTEDKLKKYSENLKNQVDKKTYELKETLERLKDSEKKYRNLFEIAPIGIGIIDKNTNIIEINKAFKEITGYHSEGDRRPDIDFDLHCVNKKDREIIHQKLFKNGCVANYEIQLKRANGEIYTALLNINTIHVNGKPCWLTIERDISELKIKDQEIKNAYSYLENTINSASEIIFSVDKKLNFTMYNNSFLDLIDDHKKRIKGISLKSFIENPSVITDCIHKIKKGRKTVKDTVSINSKNGEKRLFSFSITGIGNDRTNPEGFLFIGVDITVDASRFGKIREGIGYLVIDPSQNKIFDLMEYLQIKGYNGAFHTRLNPEYQKKINYDDSLILELYPEIPFNSPPSEDYLQKQLNHIKKQVETHPKCFIVIDRVDYLLTFFSFDMLLKWLYSVSAMIAKHQAILFIHIPQDLVSNEQFAYLSAEFSLLPDQHIENISLEEPVYKILTYLKSEQEKNVLVSYHNVGKNFNISKITTKKRLDELEKHGLISIHEKGRMKVIRLTGKGEKLLNKREVV